MSKTLIDCGIATETSITLVYDFKPISRPMLTVPFSYRTADDKRVV